MPRIQLDVPARFAFSTVLPLLRFHINWAGHADNVQLLTLVSEARWLYFQHLGFSEEFGGDIGTMVADTAVQYRSEAHHGETMVVEVTPGDPNRYGFDLLFRMRDQATGREVLRAKNGLVFFDYVARKITPMPEVFRAALQAEMAAPQAA